MANAITIFRMAASIVLLFCPVFSPAFYVFYIMAGLSDMLEKKFVAVHSVMNKATGALLFLLPLTIPFLSLKYSAIVVCALATFAAIQEGYLIRTGELAGREGYQI